VTLAPDFAFAHPGYETSEIFRFDFQTAKDTKTVIASEAKQSIKQQEKMDCFVRFAPRNDVAHSRRKSAISRRNAPEYCCERLALLKNRGRGERRVPAAPAASRAK